MAGLGTLRTFEGKNVILPGIEFLADTHITITDDVVFSDAPLGSIYFVHGISACWEDYTPLLVPLANSFNVYAYNQRGHAGAPGKFDPRTAADDLESIIEKERDGRVGILAHSLGGGLATVVAKRFQEKGEPIDGIFMLEPYLGLRFLRRPQRYGVKMLKAVQPALKIIDRFLNMAERLRRNLGFHQRDVLDSFASMSDMHARDSIGVRSRVGYILTENDRVLGTNHQSHYFACMEILKALFPHGLNYTHTAISHLNHCLNVDVKGDPTSLVPFLKRQSGVPEREAQRDYVIGSIYSFFKYAFEAEKH